MLGFWKNASRISKRMMVVVVVFIVTIAVTAVGAMVPLSRDDVDELGRSLNQTRNTVDSLSFLDRVKYIFGNNLMICLLGFIPVFGILLELYALFSTGVVIAAMAYGTTNPLLMLFLLFVFPHTWLEFISYSLAISGNVWLSWRIIRRRDKKELFNTCIFIALCTLILLLAAFVEILTINLLQ